MPGFEHLVDVNSWNLSSQLDRLEPLPLYWGDLERIGCTSAMPSLQLDDKLHLGHPQGPHIIIGPAVVVPPAP